MALDLLEDVVFAVFYSSVNELGLTLFDFTALGLLESDIGHDSF